MPEAGCQLQEGGEPGGMLTHDEIRHGLRLLETITGLARAQLGCIEAEYRRYQSDQDVLDKLEVGFEEPLPD